MILVKQGFYSDQQGSESPGKGNMRKRTGQAIKDSGCKLREALPFTSVLPFVFEGRAHGSNLGYENPKAFSPTGRLATWNVSRAPGARDL